MPAEPWVGGACGGLAVTGFEGGRGKRNLAEERLDSVRTNAVGATDQRGGTPLKKLGNGGLKRLGRVRLQRRSRQAFRKRGAGRLGECLQRSGVGSLAGVSEKAVRLFGQRPQRYHRARIRSFAGEQAFESAGERAWIIGAIGMGRGRVAEQHEIPVAERKKLPVMSLRGLGEERAGDPAVMRLGPGRGELPEVEDDGDPALRCAQSTMRGLEEQLLGRASVPGPGIGSVRLGGRQQERFRVGSRERRHAPWRWPAIPEGQGPIARRPPPVRPNQRTGLSILGQGHLGGNARSC